MALELNQANFQTEVENSALPVFVDFWAPWCGPCRMMSAIVDTLADKFAGKVKVCKINVDDNPDLATKYTVSTIPTMLLFKNGQVVFTQVGVISEAELETKINEHLLP